MQIPTSCELVTNGGFETGDFSGFNTTIPNPAVFDVRSNAGNYGNANMGTYYLFTGEFADNLGGTISQVLGNCPGTAPTCTLSLYLYIATGFGVSLSPTLI